MAKSNRKIKGANQLTSFRDEFGTQWFLVKSFSLSVDLSEFATFLRQKRFQFRITEESGEQKVWLADENSIPVLARFIEDWQGGVVQLDIEKQAPGKAFFQFLNLGQLALSATPITFALLFFSLIGYCIVEFESILHLAKWFTYIETNWQYYGQVRIDIADWSQPWRIFTPIFLHFGLTHLVFNCLVLWVFGARIERVLGLKHFLAFVLVVGGASNFAQFQMLDNAFFGGMSGVNYGFIGFIWIRQMIAPHPLLNVPPPFIYFSLGMLVLGMTGLVDRFMEGSIANTAHVTGLILGVTWAYLSGIKQSSIKKMSNKNSSDKEPDAK